MLYPGATRRNLWRCQMQSNLQSTSSFSFAEIIASSAAADVYPACLASPSLDVSAKSQRVGDLGFVQAVGSRKESSISGPGSLRIDDAQNVGLRRESNISSPSSLNIDGAQTVGTRRESCISGPGYLHIDSVQMNYAGLVDSSQNDNIHVEPNLAGQQVDLSSEETPAFARDDTLGVAGCEQVEIPVDRPELDVDSADHLPVFRLDLSFNTDEASLKAFPVSSSFDDVADGEFNHQDCDAALRVADSHAVNGTRVDSLGSDGTRVDNLGINGMRVDSLDPNDTHVDYLDSDDTRVDSLGTDAPCRTSVFSQGAAGVEESTHPNYVKAGPTDGAPIEHVAPFDSGSVEPLELPRLASHNSSRVTCKVADNNYERAKAWPVKPLKTLNAGGWPRSASHLGVAPASSYAHPVPQQQPNLVLIECCRKSSQQPSDR